jgi:hypothetical protein
VSRRGGLNRLVHGFFSPRVITGVCPTRPAGGVRVSRLPPQPPPRRLPSPRRTGRSISITTYRVGLRPIPLMCPLRPSSKYNRTSALHNLRQLQHISRLDDTVTPRNSNAHRSFASLTVRPNSHTPNADWNNGSPLFADVLTRYQTFSASSRSYILLTRGLPIPHTHI